MKDWISLQKQLYHRAIREVAALLKPTAELRRYEKVFEDDFTGLKKVSSDLLLHDFAQSEIVFIGDFHTLRQSQRLFYRLLRDSKVPRPHAIGLEVLKSKDEAKVQRWIDSKEFDRLKDFLQLESLWGSSWETYEDIFKFCSQKKIKVLGLSGDSKNLQKRDQFAASRILKYGKRLWVLFGEHHIAKAHIPRIIRKRQPQKKILILQQNHDRTSLKYLPLLSTQKALVLKSEKTKDISFYCILHCPIWMKWQSFLEWQMQLSNEDFSPEGFDPYEQLTWSLKTLYEFLSDARYVLPIPLKESLDFHVYGPEDPDFYRELSELKPAIKRNVLRQLATGNVGIALRPHRIFLSELTFNSCAHAAGSLLYRLNSQIENQDEGFFQRCLTEGMSYFLSKLLNHSRRAPNFPNHSKLQMALDFPLHFSNASHLVKATGLASNKLSMLLGRQLAEWLFEAFLAGEFSKVRLIRLVGEAPLRERDAFEKLIEMKSVGESYSRSLLTRTNL